MNPRRAAILREMGYTPLWRLRGLAETVPAAAPQPAVEPAPPGLPAREEAPPAQVSMAPPSRAEVPPTIVRPARPAVAPAGVPAAAQPDPQRDARIATLDWDALDAEITACRACGLCERRKQAVPGVGDRAAEWLFVGEGPGAEEDERGEPFVGQAGKLLDAMLAALGLARGRGVYIANAVKCRPPGNRTPEAPEIAACNPFLQRQIDLLQPRIIVALGRPAAQALLGSEVKIGEVRGKVLRHGSIPLVVTYHPAYLLRNLPDKAKAWADLCFARDTLRRLGADA